MRRPYAGDPEVLDVEEFMQAGGHHEDSLNTAANLGLMVSDITYKNSINQNSHANSIVT
jgi:hypothetical protein